MSLFDVIRYPITDIYDDAELDTLPEEIWLAWIEILRPGHNPEDSNRSTIVRLIQQTELLVFIRERNLKNGAGALIKAQMTKRLKEVIAAYETN
jgi:hypothetical protein